MKQDGGCLEKDTFTLCGSETDSASWAKTEYQFLTILRDDERRVQQNCSPDTAVLRGDTDTACAIYTTYLTARLKWWQCSGGLSRFIDACSQMYRQPCHRDSRAIAFFLQARFRIVCTGNPCKEESLVLSRV